MVLASKINNFKQNVLDNLYKSCNDILIKNPTFRDMDGIYNIDPDGTGLNPPFKVFCDMTEYNGGWTLIFVGDMDLGGTYNTNHSIYKGTVVSSKNVNILGSHTLPYSNMQRVVTDVKFSTIRLMNYGATFASASSFLSKFEAKSNMQFLSDIDGLKTCPVPSSSGWNLYKAGTYTKGWSVLGCNAGSSVGDANYIGLGVRSEKNNIYTCGPSCIGGGTGCVDTIRQGGDDCYSTYLMGNTGHRGIWSYISRTSKSSYVWIK